MKYLLLCLALALGAMPAAGQLRLAPDARLADDLVRSGILHSPLPLDYDRSYETNGLKKNIRYRQPLILTRDLARWSPAGWGTIAYAPQPTVSGKGSLRLSFPTFTGKRVRGSDDDPDYGTYGNARAVYDAQRSDFGAYNRIAFSIYPDCEGARVVNLNLSFGGVSHLVNLINREWNHHFLDIGNIPRAQITNIAFGASIKGRDRTTGDSSVYYIDRIELQYVDDLEIEHGWQPAPGRIAYSSTGYMTNDRKTAITSAATAHTAAFRLVDTETNRSVFEGSVQRTKTTIGEFGLIDFSSFNRPGSYRLEAGHTTTPPFRIDDNLWENSLWRVLNFIFCQRCGYPVPGIHGACHADLCSEHDGKKISYNGGWHDAGDLSQQTLQTADVAYALLEAYNKLKNNNPLLAARMLEEAEWGLEFVLKNRYGDGYRASSVGLLIWQDGVFHTLDDISTVRVQNLAFDNFLYAAYEAYAAMSIDRDPMMQEYLRRVAEEDFAFALKRHEEVGFGEFLHFYEHSYNTSESQYMATISWAASMLYKLSGQSRYAEMAAQYIRYTLDCQRKEPIGRTNPVKGFFYRDQSKQSIVHYIHQSREQVYMQALTLLCETQPHHPDYPSWTEAIRLYGDYLKSLMPYTAPYGMLPSGVYHIDEPEDSTAFYRLHLFPPDNAKDLYAEQVTKGVPLEKGFYLKRFPVWFSVFNGNTAVHLSAGKAAAICGKFLGDEELMRIGREQMYWTVGKNPFGQSLIHGEGYNYPQLDSFSSGEITGAMPVGIRSLDNEDVPYWPQVNNACYKEVWVTSAGKWLTLAIEY